MLKKSFLLAGCQRKHPNPLLILINVYLNIKVNIRLTHCVPRHRDPIRVIDKGIDTESEIPEVPEVPSRLH